MRNWLLCLLFVPVVVVAEPIEALKPMAFLAGHCWKGDFADGKQTDEHCFQWLYGGKALRDSDQLIGVISDFPDVEPASQLQQRLFDGVFKL